MINHRNGKVSFCPSPVYETVSRLEVGFCGISPEERLFFLHFAEHSRKRRSQKACKRIAIRINAVNLVRVSLGHLVSRSPYRQRFIFPALLHHSFLCSFPVYRPLYRSLLQVSQLANTKSSPVSLHLSSQSSKP